MPALPSVKPFKTSTPEREPWVVRHWQQVLLALAAGGAAILLAVLVSSKLKAARARGWEQLSFSLSQASQGQRAEALKTLDDLLSAQRSGPLAIQGLLMKSDLLMGQGRKPDALSAAREALRQAETPEYKALASMGLAYALEQAGQPADAAGQYENFIKEFPDHFLTGRAYAQLGRLQSAQGQMDKAKATYEKLVTLYPSTVWARDAKAALEDMRRPTAGK